jgi:hypothetical protein
LVQSIDCYANLAGDFKIGASLIRKSNRILSGSISTIEPLGIKTESIGNGFDPLYLRVAELEGFSHALGVLTHCLSFRNFYLNIFIFL